MTITTSDIKLLKSERLTDFVDGGGRMTGNEVVDGVLNNLFGDISHLDRVYGRVSLRKAYFSVLTPNSDTLHGSMAMVTDPPSDGSVHVLLFSTGSWVDERQAARVRIENYRIKGVTSRFVLYGLHPAGMRQVQVYCLSETASPDINDVLCLSVESGVSIGQEQFVKVQRLISRTTQTFIDLQGSFQRDVLQIETTTPLQYDFVGREEPSRLTGDYPPTRVRLTQVADAASYYSIVPTVAAADTGASTLQIASPFVPLVPSTLAETAVTDLLAGMGYAGYVQSGEAGALTLSSSVGSTTAGVEVLRYFGTSFTRNSLVITAPAALTDDGNGGIVGTAGWSGTVDYAEGSFTLQRDTGWSGSITASATPAGVVVAQSYSRITPITAGNRQYTYIDSVQPLPAPGTVVVDYRALNRWIRLRDNGLGQLSGEQAGTGTGTINYATGSLAITLPVLPDVDSAIIVSIGTPKQTDRRNGDAAIEAPYITAMLPELAVKPSSLTITWTAGGLTKTATDNGFGAIGGDATGHIVYSTGEVGFKPAVLPDVSTAVVFEYAKWAPQNQTFTPTVSGGGSIAFTLTAPVEPGTVLLRWTGLDTGTPSNPIGVYHRVTEVQASDNGGHLFGRASSGVPLEELGTINYSTGECVLQVEFVEPGFVPQFTPYRNGNRTCLFISGYTLENIGLTYPSGTPLVADWVLDGASDSAVEYEIEAPPVVLDLTPTVVDSVVPGSVRFDFRGRTYVDRAGSLYYGVDATNNAGTYAGTIAYATGKATVTDYAEGGSNTVTIKSLLTSFREPGVSNIFARTPGAPLRPGSFTIRANRMDTGEMLTGTADINGVITGDEMAGTVDWQTGIFDVMFGQLVTAAGNEAEPWYDTDWIVSGQIWRPTQVSPSTIFVNTVVYRNVPLDPSLLGLDPVRLPDDGKVLAYKPAGVALLHHTETESVASPTPGQIVDLGREVLDFIEVRDSAGVAVLSSWYVIDRDAGTVTFSDPLNLSAYTLPILIRHTIAHLCVMADVQITGEIGFAPPLTRDFPSGSYLSGCLIAPGADLQGRVANVFEQATWTGVWSDARIGDAPSTASFNDAVYPIAVTNDGAITERWALIFTNTSQFSVVGEEYGVIGTGNITTNTAINNPATGEPLFTIDYRAFGSGWAAGNVVRLNTIGAGFPIWIARTTLAGPVVAPSDQFRIRLMGDSL